MKTLILIGLVLVPGLVYAGTLCKVTEFPEYYEVVCTGDEKAVPVPDSSARVPESSTPAIPSGTTGTAGSAPSNQTFMITPTPIETTTSRSSQQNAAAMNQTMIIPKNALTDETANKNQTAAIPSTATSDTIVHRQGRQQYNKALQDAIAARLKLLAQ